ncbi:MAG TPA: hypothetical protein VG099_23335 [Gemmataceae bacterium]|jgi:hypothetical protein|nr:hypothetical protein [Gemmataceae bacterium]
MLEQLQTWWQNTTPEIKAAVQEGGWLLLALVGGYFVGSVVARALRAKNFDAAVRLSTSSLGANQHEFTPTWAAGMLVRLTVWAGAGSWLCHRHGREDLAATIGMVINRTWAFAAIVLAALTVASLLARRLMECLHGPAKPDAWGRNGNGNGNGNGAQRWDAAGAVGAGVYLVVVLLALLFTADVFDWPLTRTSALALWEFAQHLLVAVAALFIGALGARWARDLATGDGAATPEKRAGQYTAVGIMAGTTVLAVLVLLSGAGVLIALTTLAVLGVLLWLGRGHLPDVVAGLQLRAQKVREVYLDGEAWQVSQVGFLTTQVCRAGEFCRARNRLVLEARMHAAPARAASR